MMEITQEYDKYDSACKEANQNWSDAIDDKNKDDITEQRKITYMNLGALKAIYKIKREIQT